VSAADTAHRVGTAILFMVGVQDEQDSERPLEYRVWLILKFRSLEHHVQEVAFVAEIVIRIGILHADAVTVSEGGDGRHFRNQPVDLFLPTFLVKNVFGIRIKGRQRAERSFKHAHRMRVVVKAVDYFFDALINERVIGDVTCPVRQLRPIRQLAIEE